jgi:hypothetical protein
LKLKTQGDYFMTNDVVVLVRGFDIFYENASEKFLENIARNLGGRFSFSIAEGRATYMFESIKLIKMTDIQNIHEIVDDWGNALGIMHNCKYCHSELYVTCPEEYSNYL